MTESKKQSVFYTGNDLVAYGPSTGLPTPLVVKAFVVAHKLYKKLK